MNVNLTLHGFSHVFPGDVALLLVAPDGRNALVMADVGDAQIDEVSDLTLTLDDEATEPLPESTRLTSGSFRPRDGGVPGLNGTIGAFPAPAPQPSDSTTLATFDGENPNEEWQLFILDDENVDGGAIASGWSLEITAKAKGKHKHHPG